MISSVTDCGEAVQLCIVFMPQMDRYTLVDHYYPESNCEIGIGKMLGTQPHENSQAIFFGPVDMVIIRHEIGFRQFTRRHRL